MLHPDYWAGLARGWDWGRSVLLPKASESQALAVSPLGSTSAFLTAASPSPRGLDFLSENLQPPYDSGAHVTATRER